ncbi:pollen-specific leucine-rich repeat extensin-like protein 1 [Homalodisca vitripennis]|uniref:pollen-specific leucine-rich repeat extensin-like protein 1 n=1 Tax=Homalodisca vitripennis TaxID=197043 RepID=UPI001EEBE90B|nr:pollen-specific leucine-rich repeat extensin-like protein 1 [Homalodisca vitripennis]
MKGVVLCLLLVCLSLAYAAPGAGVDFPKPPKAEEKAKSEEPPKPEDKPKDEEPPKPEDKPKDEEPPKPEDKPKGEEPPKPEDKPKGEEQPKPEDSATTTEIPLEMEVFTIFENDRTKVEEETVEKQKSASKTENADVPA